MNSTCTVLNGAVTRILNGQSVPTKESYKRGNNFRHGEFQRYFYGFADDTSMVCYGRGAVPLSYLWVATNSISVGDPVSLGKIFYHYSQGLIHELTVSAYSLFNEYKAKVRKSEL
uniref:Sigma non-opioid intracellular receptor 1 n=1 Tax=Syphacia muris TaxID=451379 RepID=A0A0N5ALN2_9BILA